MQKEKTSTPEFYKPAAMEREKGIPRQVAYNATRKGYRGDFPKPIRMDGGIYIPAKELEAYIEKAKRRAR